MRAKKGKTTVGLVASMNASSKVASNESISSQQEGSAAFHEPQAIEVRGARVHNLKNIDVDVPLHELVSIAGVSGSGKSSLALGVLYAEGSRRYLEALSTYTRRRISQTTRAQVDEVLHVPAAIALHQRPGAGGVHSTFGTSTELLNYLRLLFSRLGSHECPNGHHVPPSLNVAAEKPLECPICHVEFYGPSAEDLAFNSAGACPTCGGTGVVREVDEDTLIADPKLTLEEGAVAPWRQLMWSLMPQVAKEMGVRIDVPYCELTPKEQDIVLHGPMEKKHILYVPKNKDHATELDFTYYSAVNTVKNALSKVKDDKGLARVAKFLKQEACPDCGDSRLSTGVLYVLDEPSIGLHPSNVEGLLGVMDDLLGDGNSVVVIDHDVRVLEQVNWIIEIGPGYGAHGGRVIAQGTVDEVESDPASRIGPYLSGKRKVDVRSRVAKAHLFDEGAIHLETGAIHTLSVDFPIAHLTSITGVSGSGKTTLILESLVPALVASFAGKALPAHVHQIDPGDIERVHLIDSTPIGANIRSTVATYSGVLDILRRSFAALPAAKERGLKAGAFSYNTGSLRCPTCDGTGQISLDVQFLPDVDIPCPDCGGSRYGKEAYQIRLPLQVLPDELNELDGESEQDEADELVESIDAPETAHDDELSLPEILALTVDQLLALSGNLPSMAVKLRTLSELGLGYLTLGEATPALSGGEAQRLKLAGEMHKKQQGALFVFDEPTIGLHPHDVEVLLRVLQRLIDKGATVIVIEHDLDMIANSDYVIDLGPGGGEAGGAIVATGTPEDIAADPQSITGKYLLLDLE